MREQPHHVKVPRQRRGRAIPTQRPADPSDPVRLYLRDIGRIPLLTASDEVRLAHAIEVGLLAEERIARQPDVDAADRRDLLELADTGRAAKTTLVQSNLRLVVALAKRYGGSGIALLDLVQEGNVGLIRAVEKFDYQRGFKFSTYATWWIRQAIARGFADQSRTIRLPVHVVESMQRAVHTQRDMFQVLGRKPTLDELAARLEMPVDKTRTLLNLVDEPVSLDLAVGTGESGRLSDLITDDAEALPSAQVDMLMLHVDVEPGHGP